MSQHDAQGYWKENIRIILGCLIVWALCSLGFGVLFRPLLSGIAVGSTDLGFWFAQQGSIITFVIIIFYYSWRMGKLDEKYGVKED